MAKNNYCGEVSCWDERCGDHMCYNCTVNTLHIDEDYMLRDELWFRIEAFVIEQNTSVGEPVPKILMMCIGCVEKLLGERLCSDDFMDAPVNWPTVGRKSPRLLNRLGLLGVTLEEAEAWEHELYSDYTKFLR